MSRSVLVAESDATELELIATVLARDGFRVLQALERDQAMELFASEEIALVIAASDVGGRGGGATLCGEVKKQRAATRVVILHPSGNDPDARSVLLSRTGCDAVLPSPFRYDALKRILGEWGLAAPVRQSAPMSFAVPPPDVASLVAAPSVPELAPDTSVEGASSLPMAVPPPAMPLPLEPVVAQAPIPIPVVFPTTPVPVLAEYGGEPAAVEEPKVEEPAPGGAAPVLPTSVFDEPGAAAAADGSFAASFAELTVTEGPITVAPVPDDDGPTTASPPAEAPPPLPVGALDDEPTVRASSLVAATMDDDEVTTRADPPAATLDDEPTVRASALAAALGDDSADDDSTIHDRVTVEIPNPGEAPPLSPSSMAEVIESAPIEPVVEPPPIPEPVSAEADLPLPGPATDEPPPAPSPDAVKGDWLLARPPEGAAQDGFAGIDLSGGIDSALDNALGDSPTARFDTAAALSDEAARSVALAVQAYVAESLAIGDEPPPADEAAPALPPAAAFFAEPPPVAAEPSAESTRRTIPSLVPPPIETGGFGPSSQSEAPAPTTWQVMEPGAGRLDLGDTDAALADLETPTPGRWEVREPSRAAPEEPVATPPPPHEEVREPVAVAPPPPPPPDEERTAWAAKGASSWSPVASSSQPELKALAFQMPGAAAKAPPAAPPPPPPSASASAPATAPLAAPPPPPPEALDEPPALPFEGIVQRTPIGTEPRTTLPPSVPPEGDLSTTPLPRLLFELYGGTYCGTLRLSRKGVDRIIDVWNGFPVAVTVSPTDEDDDLATLLRDHGRITPEQYDDAKRRANGREAQLLVALGIIDERDLLDAIREQTEQRLAASFSWRDGSYKITPSRAPPDSVVLSEVHPVKIIWRGVCEHYDVGSLLAFFSPLRARFIVGTEVFPIHYETIGPFLRSVGVAPLLNGKTTFEQALRSDDSHALTIAHTLYVLIVTEMIRAQSKPGEGAKFPDAAAAARQSKPVDYRELTRACEEVARTYLTLKGHDYFTMLQVAREATEKEVATAYDRLARPFKLENLLPGLPDDVQRRAREIDQLLRRARDTLSSPEERRRYLTRLEDNQPPPPPADALAS